MGAARQAVEREFLVLADISSNGRVAPHRLNIAIDLDGVLTEHPRPLALAATAKFGLPLPESAFVDSAGLNVPTEVRDWVYGPDGPAAELIPAPEAQEFIARVIELLGENNVRILTARPEGTAEMTRAWLHRHGFPECAIKFSDDKAAVALECGCTYAVEDSVRHARNYAASGVTCFLIMTPTTPPIADDPNIIRVDSPMSIIYQLKEIVAEHRARHALEAKRRLPALAS